MTMAYVAGLHVGSVESSSPSEIKILLDTDAPQDTAFNTGRPQGFPRLNGYVLIPNEGGSVVALVVKMTMEPAPQSSEERSAVFAPRMRRRLFVTPMGTLESCREAGRATFRLRRGVASYPAVGDAVLLPTSEQQRAIVEASGTDTRVHIGSSSLAANAKVTVDPDKLFGRHVGVFGNTGSGKSCTVAGLIRWSIEQAQRDGGPVLGRFIILDPNGEYRTCFNDLSRHLDVKVFSVEPSQGESSLTVPAWMWNGEEWAGMLDASPGTQRPILMQAIRQLRAAALHRGEGVEGQAQPADQVVLAIKVKAYIDYLDGLRLQGVAHLSDFRVFGPLHDNLAGLEAMLQEFLVQARPQNLRARVEATIGVSNVVRARRTNGKYKNAFVDGDLGEVSTSLTLLAAELPVTTALTGPSEDTPAPFDIQALPGMITLMAGLQGGNNVQQHMAGLDLRLRTILADSRIMPIIAPQGARVSFSNWLHGLIGTGIEGRGQLSIIDLSLVPSDVLTTIVSVLARLVFESAQRYRRTYRVTAPGVIVLEEAHNFVQRASQTGTENSQAVRCRQVFEKIAKEGRKFGVGLMLSSQRPAELSPTIVAQCNSFVLHRIVNDRDQELVSKLAPDASGAILKELPSLPTQKAILMGLAAEIPLGFDVRALGVAQRPNSSNPDFWDVWTGARIIDHDFEEVAASWSH